MSAEICAGLLHAGDEVIIPLHRKPVTVYVEATTRGTTGTRNIVIVACVTCAGEHETCGLFSDLPVTRLHDGLIAGAA